MHLAPVPSLSLCALLLLCFVLHTPSAYTTREVASPLSLLLFFLSTAEEDKCAINGDRAKGCASSQFLLALVI
jgi:hypothetical protein